VTEAKEVAMEAPERDNSPRWPTNMTDMILRQKFKRVTDIKGPASHNCFFTSSITSLLSIPLPDDDECECLINGD